MNRILWNRRPTHPADGGDIDEIVMTGVNIHIEQMGDRCWWVGIARPGGTMWMGNFSCDSRGRMRFMQQDDEGVRWDRDDTHEATA